VGFLLSAIGAGSPCGEGEDFVGHHHEAGLAKVEDGAGLVFAGGAGGHDAVAARRELHRGRERGLEAAAE
jgi:hypothetical protein